jgi:hypothetical protein
VGVARRRGRGVQGFVKVLARLERLGQVQGEGRDGVPLDALEPIELRPIRQGGKGPAQMALGPAEEVAFAGELAPLPEDGQRHDFGPRQGRGRSRARPLGQVLLCEVVNH